MFYRFIFLAVFYLCVQNNTIAQQPSLGMYKAKNGHVIITAKNDSTVITGQSDQLLIVLNCENAEMIARLDINTISTGIAYYDSQLSSNMSTAVFVGKMGVDLVKMVNPVPIESDVEGTLTINSISRPMIMKTSLNEIPDQQNAGMFSGNLAISLSDFNLRSQIPYASDLLLIQFKQVLLKRVCE